MRRGFLLALILLLAARAALAGTEDFSSFSVFAQEEDDESLIDHIMARPARAWRDEWERSSQALRSSQGCLTSGLWLVDTQLKLRTPMGDHARFGLDLRDQQSDASSVQYFDFSFRFPTPAGTPGAMFRPAYDKSTQDFALFWEAGQETSATVARVTFTFEDVFNDLWAFRQTRVGENSEPYERHPFEPALWLRVRRPNWDAELGGQWLTPSRKRLATGTPGDLETRLGLWGGLGYADVEARVAGLELELAGSNRQARSRQMVPGAGVDGTDFRRQWSVETAVRRRLTTPLEAEIRWLYQERYEGSAPPFASRTLGVVERVLQAETRYARGRWVARVGAMHDRVTRGLAGDYLPSYATRIESRAYVGFGARFGRVSVDGVEGIELDPEPYAVWLVHDKAYLHLQTTF